MPLDSAKKDNIWRWFAVA